MSKDIRSFFVQGARTKSKTTNGKQKSYKNNVTALSDVDVIPESPDVGVKVKDRKSKKRRIIIDEDSDEEIFDKKAKTSLCANKQSKDKKSVLKTPVLKEVKASDIFGSGPIKRTPVEKKSKQNGDVKIKNESDIHLDAEFNKTLTDIDVTHNDKSSENDNVSPVKFAKESEYSSHEVQKSPHKSKLEVPSHKYEKKTKIAEETSKPKIYENDTSTSKKPVNNVKHKSSSTEKFKDSPKKNKFTTLDSEVNLSSKSDKCSYTHEKQSEKEKLKTETIYEDTSRKKKIINEVKSEHSSTQKSRISPRKDFEVELHPRSEEKCLEPDTEDKLCGTLNAPKKRDFSEFLDETETVSTADESFSATPSQVKKRLKKDQTLNESVISDEERYERKRYSAVLYQKYLNRTGPKHLGSKPIPEGKPDCFKSKVFLLTGILESFEREEIVDVIKKYGGEVKSGISKKVTHVLAGEDAGPSKLSKAEELGITILNEDQFLNLICPKARNQNGVDLKSDKNSKNFVLESSAFNTSSHSKSNSTSKKSPKEKIETVTSKISPKKNRNINEELNAKVLNDDSRKEKTNQKLKLEKMDSDSSTKSIEVQSKLTPTARPEYTLAWVDKYKPQTLKQIIGQHGAASNVSKLVSWLRNWSANRKKKLSKPSPWAKNDDGGYFKAALLSGPPGVGKTTTVSLVCKELGLDTVEFNASDTRSKSLIKQQISELLTTKSLAGYVHGKSGKDAVTKEHVLVMDEVDGMAGNEDRGGLQELISLIRVSSVPIVCMCNDRNSPKMRSLVNYCYDLRFSRPQLPQIKAAMMSVCFKEGLKIPSEALTQVITAANQDVRQTLNLLCMWSATGKLNGDPNNKVHKTKDIKLGSWEVVRKVFSAEEQAGMSIHDKSDLFFHDYSIAPLFVQENYLHVAPNCHKDELLKRVSASADSLSIGDLVEAKIRGQGAWSLLPVQAMYSSVIPGHAMEGHMAGQIQFPAWLGKNSRSNKMHRLAQEIHAHTRLSTSGSKEAVYLDYAMHLRNGVTHPLTQHRTEGVPAALALLQAYHLTREDLDSITELSLWPGQKDPMLMVDSKVKAAMTRAYNKEAAPLPYAPGVAKRRTVATEPNTVEGDEGDEEEGNGTDDDNVDNDGLIKKKKPASNKEAGASGSRSRAKKSK